MERFDKQLILILLLGLITRVFAIHFFGDNLLENEWGILVKNLENKNIFGFRSFDGEVLPTIYMPPLYAYFLYFLKIFSPINETYYVNFVLYVQLLLSLISIVILNKLLKDFFSDIIRKIGIITFTFFPLNIYSITQISSVSVYIFLSTFYFYFIFLTIKNKKINFLIFFSIVSSLLILTRGEFFLIYFLTLIFLFLKGKNIRLIFISLCITIFLVSPYLVRNYLIFNTITITKTTGYNLWKGNNQFSNSEGYENIENKKLQESIKNLKISKKYDLDYDNLFKHQAIKNLSQDPIKYFVMFIRKNISFYFFDFQSSYPNYFNFAHIVPKIILGIFALIGGIQSIFIRTGKQKDIKFFLLYYLIYGIIFSVFFILPRYSLMLLPVQIVLLCVSLSQIKYLKKFK